MVLGKMEREGRTHWTRRGSGKRGERVLSGKDSVGKYMGWLVRESVG